MLQRALDHEIIESYKSKGICFVFLKHYRTEFYIEIL